MHRPAAVSMFAAGFALICEKVQAFRVKRLKLIFINLLHWTMNSSVSKVTSLMRNSGLLQGKVLCIGKNNLQNKVKI